MAALTLLRFGPEETKTGEPIEMVLPDDLRPGLEVYLQVHRKHLLARGDGQADQSLWIDRWGKPMIEHAVRDQIRIRTEAAFGQHVWPHLFRTIAATGFVDHAPEQAALLPDLLGHSEIQTTKRYYVLSSATQAHRAVQASLQDRRKAARQRLKQGGYE